MRSLILEIIFTPYRFGCLFKISGSESEYREGQKELRTSFYIKLFTVAGTTTKVLKGTFYLLSHFEYFQHYVAAVPFL